MLPYVSGCNGCEHSKVANSVISFLVFKQLDQSLNLPYRILPPYRFSCKSQAETKVPRRFSVLTRYAS